MAGADEADLLSKDQGTEGRSGEGERSRVAKLKLRQCYSETAQPVGIPLTEISSVERLQAGPVYRVFKL